MSGKATTRLGLAGLLAVAAMIVMAVGASAAFASEFQTNEGKINEVTFTGSGVSPHFEAEKGGKVACESSSSTGKVLEGEKAEVTVTYKGKCTLSGAALGNGKCTNGPSGTEEIKTEALTVQPGNKLDPSTVEKIGLLFSSSSGTLAKFSCEGVSVTVKGTLVCEAVGNNVGESAPYENKGKVVCKEKENELGEEEPGQQMYTSIEVGGKNLTGQELKAEAIFTNEKEAQVTTEELTYSKPVRET